MQAGNHKKEHRITSISRYASSKNLKETSRDQLHRYVMRSILSVCLGIAVLCFAGVIHGEIALKDYQAQIKAAVMARNNEQKQVDHLKNQVALLHDDNYLLKLARGRYYLSKKNEIIFSTPEDNDSIQAKNLNKAYLQAQENQTSK